MWILFGFIFLIVMAYILMMAIALIGDGQGKWVWLTIFSIVSGIVCVFNGVEDTVYFMSFIAGYVFVFNWIVKKAAQDEEDARLAEVAKRKLNKGAKA